MGFANGIEGRIIWATPAFRTAMVFFAIRNVCLLVPPDMSAAFADVTMMLVTLSHHLSSRVVGRSRPFIHAVWYSRIR